MSKKVAEKKNLNTSTVKQPISDNNKEGMTQSNESLSELNNVCQNMANTNDPFMETKRKRKQIIFKNCDKVTMNDNDNEVDNGNDNDDIHDDEQNAKRARTPGKSRFRFCFVL